MKWLIVLTLIPLASGCGHLRVAHHGEHAHRGGDTVLICHKGKKTMELPREAAQGHLGHGDRYGRC